jgi:hypothetical protein
LVEFQHNFEHEHGRKLDEEKSFEVVIDLTDSDISFDD